MTFIVSGKNEVSTSMEKSKAIEIVKDCLQRLGQVTEFDQTKLIGRIKYGLQKVIIHISWIEDSNETRFTFQSSGDDIWGVGARNATARMVELVRNHNVPGYNVDRLGMRKSVLIATLVLFIFCVGFLVKLIL